MLKNGMKVEIIQSVDSELVDLNLGKVGKIVGIDYDDEIMVKFEDDTFGFYLKEELKVLDC